MLLQCCCPSASSPLTWMDRSNIVAGWQLHQKVPRLVSGTYKHFQQRNHKHSNKQRSSAQDTSSSPVIDSCDRDVSAGLSSQFMTNHHIAQ